MKRPDSSTATGHSFAAAALALSAAGVLEVARITAQGPSPTTLLGLLVVAFALALVRYRLHRCADRQPLSRIALTVLVVALATVPTLVELACEEILHRGQPPEFTVQVWLRNLAFALVALPPAMNLQRLGCLTSLFSLIFASSLGSSPLRWPLILLHGAAGAWWLTETHWRPLAGCLVAQASQRQPWRIGVLVAIGLPMVLASLALSRATTTAALTGWLPTSGGTRRSSDRARGGVGDGDALVAATKDAASIGPVESDLFMASEMPSLYDMANDRYGDAVKIKSKVERAVALGVNRRRQLEKRLAQTERLQREFSAVRNGPSPRPEKPLADRRSNALFYLAGRTPLHLRMETFDAFDGIAWSNGAAQLSGPGLQGKAPANRGGTPPGRRGLCMTSLGLQTWLDTGLIAGPHFSAELEAHVVKTTRLHSDRIPSPLGLARLHVDKIEQVSFFRWSKDGVLAMDRESIPAFTTFRLQSYVPDPELLAAAHFPPSAADLEVPSLALPKTEAQQRIGKLARSVAEGLPHGVSQVEAVVGYLRKQAVVDPRATAPTDCKDVAAHFLFRSHRGPDYLFASAAAVLLRSLGYPTRLVTGFYAAPEKFDRQSEHTPVTPADFHVWAEVCVGRGTWITIEPSPGYELLRPRQTLLQLGRWAMLAAARGACGISRCWPACWWGWRPPVTCGANCSTDASWRHGTSAAAPAPRRALIGPSGCSKAAAGSPGAGGRSTKRSPDGMGRRPRPRPGRSARHCTGR